MFLSYPVFVFSFQARSIFDCILNLLITSMCAAIYFGPKIFALFFNADEVPFAADLSALKKAMGGSANTTTTMTPSASATQQSPKASDRSGRPRKATADNLESPKDRDTKEKEKEKDKTTSMADALRAAFAKLMDDFRKLLEKAGTKTAEVTSIKQDIEEHVTKLGKRGFQQYRFVCTI